MDDLARVEQAWQRYQDDPTDDTLAAFVGAAQEYLDTGGTLPDKVARTYALATNSPAQPLPVVVVTAPDLALIAGLAALLLLPIPKGHR